MAAGDKGESEGDVEGYLLFMLLLLTMLLLLLLLLKQIDGEIAVFTEGTAGCARESGTPKLLSEACSECVCE